MCEKCVQYVSFCQCTVKFYTALQVVITENFCKKDIFITKTNVHLPCFYILCVQCIVVCLLPVDDVFG